MMEEEFILDYDRIREFREKTTKQINQYLEKLELISQNINIIVEMESFQGKTAEHIKSYLGEVYPFLIGAMRSACEDFFLKMTLYADSFTEEVDGHAHAKIPEGAMKDLQSHIRRVFSEMDTVVERANTAMAQVSDILPLERISTDEMAESYQNVLDYVKRKEDKISELDCHMCGNEILDTEKLITATKHAIEEYSEKRVITTYQSGDWKNKKSTQDLAEALQNHAVYISENKEELQKACENQERISRELQQEEAAEKRMESGLIQAGAGATMVIGGAAAIIGSLGTATPAVLYAEAAIGANLAVYGTAETAEGVQNTFLGASEDVESGSYNFLRDRVMQGNESAYLVYGKASSISGVAALPALAAYEGAVVAGGSKAIGVAKGLFISGGAALAGYGTEKAATHFGASNTTGMALGMAAEFLATRGMTTAGTKFASGGVKPTVAEVKIKWKRNYLTVREKAILSKNYVTEYKGKVIRGWKLMKNGRYLNNEFITPEGMRLRVGDATEEVVKVKRAVGDIKNSYAKSSLNSLKNIENFTDSSIEHIFEGQINRRGKAVGYHFEGIEETAGKTISGTELIPNKFGVYKAKVEVNGIQKTANGGFSTFFSRDMSPQEVVDRINEAYKNKTFVIGTKNTYQGKTISGLKINMFIDDDGKIISAFPER